MSTLARTIASKVLQFLFVENNETQRKRVYNAMTEQIKRLPIGSQIRVCADDHEIYLELAVGSEKSGRLTERF